MSTNTSPPSLRCCDDKKIKKPCVIGAYKATTVGYGDQITLRRLTVRGGEKKSKLRAGWCKKNNCSNDKNQPRKGGWEAKGINELRQIKPCSYCTLETCCHGGRRGRWMEVRRGTGGILKVSESEREAKPRTLSHAPRNMLTQPLIAETRLFHRE